MTDTGIADRLRAAGLTVVEVAGWQTRSAGSFSPRGSVNHHTAGPSSGATPSLDTVINGRPDLPGPLCNVLQSREPGEGKDKAYVIAAGRANHAGSGGWQGLSGNSSVYGLEIEHTGTEPLAEHRQVIAARIHAAMFEGDTAMVCQHSEWTTRKIDAATNVDGDHFRTLVDEARAGRAPDPIPLSDFEEPNMMIYREGSERGYVFVVNHTVGVRRHILREELDDITKNGGAAHQGCPKGTTGWNPPKAGGNWIYDLEEVPAA